MQPFVTLPAFSMIVLIKSVFLKISTLRLLITRKQLKAGWDNLLASSADGSLIIDVQGWMNRLTFVHLFDSFVSLTRHSRFDTIGLAGFSHNFGTLEGSEPPLFQAIQHFSEKHGIFEMLVAMIPVLRPFFGWTSTAARMRQMRRGLSEVAEQMLKTSIAQKGTDEVNDKSVIGLLRELLPDVLLLAAEKLNS
jgi:hypothetical protein